MPVSTAATASLPSSSPAPTGRHADPRRATSRRPSLPAALLTLVGAALLAVGGLVLGAGPAQAHDAFTGSNPADKATVATTPDAVTLDFEEPPTTIGLTVKVTGPSGDVQDGAPRIDGSTVVQPLLPAAPAGSYRIAWRVTSDDGHPVSGELTFTSSAANARQSTAMPLSPTTPSSATSSGSPTTAPAASPPATPVAASPASATDSGDSPVLPIVLVAVVVLLGGAVAVVLRRRRP